MKILLILFFCVTAASAQLSYPQDYFRNPLDIPVVLAGTFAELRSSHFHGGLDIKTRQQEGLKVYAAAEGYVSRIKISHFGYGKALYISHPNGYTTVYGHLQKFSSEIEDFIKDCQYEKESYEVEVFPNPKELAIAQNSVVAYSGNTGGSSGPHLHFEIRDNAERPLNPMLFGITAKDTRQPLVTGLYVYPKDKNANISGKNERVSVRLIPLADGNFSTENISATGIIGFGIVANDQQDFAPNKNGVSHIETSLNGNKSIEIDFKRFSFDETKHINRYIDYEYFKTKRKRIQKLFIEKNNPLSLYKDDYDDGFVTIQDSMSYTYKIRIKDFENNETWISVPIYGERFETIEDTLNATPEKTMIFANQSTILDSDKISVNFYPNTLYENTWIDYKVVSDTLFLHKDIVPLQKNVYLNFDISHFRTEDKEKLFIARLYGYYKKPSYVYTKRKENTLSAGINTFGIYKLERDDVPPTIKPINFKHKKWLSNYRYLKVNIDDALSGISKYRATINGKWILMEYDYKTNTLTYDFNDEISSQTENQLKIIVTDNVGNSSTFEATFFRK